MGFRLNSSNDEESYNDEEFSKITEDIVNLIIAHKQNILNKNIHLVSEVIENAIQDVINVFEKYDEDELSLQVVPLLTALSEASTELREENDFLKSYIIEHQIPPPKDIKN
tara:strand:- start:4124 stop:4456 length:333 start_codon:yes stop_codon:yes gene_type:complete